MIIMSKKDNMRTPMGSAGLVRYDEDTESKIKMEPKVVIFIGVAIVALEVVLFALF
jgi:preprotein translocase subunit Sec61beta